MSRLACKQSKWEMGVQDAGDIQCAIPPFYPCLLLATTPLPSPWGQSINWLGIIRVEVIQGALYGLLSTFYRPNIFVYSSVIQRGPFVLLSDKDRFGSGRVDD